MTVAGGRVLASFAYPANARGRAASVAALEQVHVWVHRAGPQAERLYAGGPPPGTDFELFEPSTNLAGSITL